MEYVIDPEMKLNSEDYAFMGDIFLTREKWKKSAGCYLMALEELHANEYDVNTKCALAAMRSGALDLSKSLTDKAFALNPNNPYAFHVDALRLFEEGDFRRAGPQFLSGIQRLPSDVGFRINYAHYLQVMGNFPEAERQYDIASILEPTQLQARFYRSMTRLTQDKFAEGFPDYELRYALFGAPVPVNGKTVWRGQEPLEGKTILLCGEQGVGDAVHFVRYATWLKQEHRVARVIVLALPSYAELISCANDVDQVITNPEGVAYDLHAPMMSMPERSMDPSGSSPWYGDGEPYLRLPESPSPSSHRPRVGFCWQGNPAHGNDRFRSIPAAAFDSLCLRQIDAINLQRDIPHGKMLDSNVRDLLTLAQEIENLSLVITVDTAIAHIAGALGVPCWVLIASNPDWRHGLVRTRSPWYGSWRLFRQTDPLQWDPVIANVRRELAIWLSQ